MSAPTLTAPDPTTAPTTDPTTEMTADMTTLELTGTTGDPSVEPSCALVAPAASRAPLPCHTVDPDLWFAESPADVETAKALCAPCPLKDACLAGALERREPWGVWGGQLVLSGVVVPRKRPRGRPRKEPIAA